MSKAKYTYGEHNTYIESTIKVRIQGGAGGA